MVTWLSSDDASKRLGVSRTTLYAYVSRGLVRSAPAPGNAHQRRYAKREKRVARQTQVAARAARTPAAAGDPRATYERGNALLFSGDAAGAVAAYREAVQLAPADPIGYRGLGLAYEQLGQTKAASRALRRYLIDEQFMSRTAAGVYWRAGGTVS